MMLKMNAGEGAIGRAFDGLKRVEQRLDYLDNYWGIPGAAAGQSAGAARQPGGAEER